MHLSHLIAKVIGKFVIAGLACLVVFSGEVAASPRVVRTMSPQLLEKIAGGGVELLALFRRRVRVYPASGAMMAWIGGPPSSSVAIALHASSSALGVIGAQAEPRRKLRGR